jgi:holo-[acyl-carrier-protein] synthase
MAIMGVGVDIVDIERMRNLRDKYGEKFLNKIFTDVEIKSCLNSKHPDEMFAARFAAKEAVMKALKAGMYAGLHYKEIEVTGGVDTQPSIKLHENAIRTAICAGVTKFSISLSHERNYAIAMVVVEN